MKLREVRVVKPAWGRGGYINEVEGDINAEDGLKKLEEAERIGLRKALLLLAKDNQPVLFQSPTACVILSAGTYPQKEEQHDSEGLRVDS